MCDVKKNDELKLVVFAPNVSRIMGGISNTAYYLSSEFSKEYDVCVVTSLQSNEKVDNCRVLSAKGKNKITNILSQLFCYRKALGCNKKKKTFVLCMSWRCAVVPYIVNRIFHIRYAILCHGNDVLYINGGLSDQIEGFLRKRIIENASIVFANSQYTASLVGELVSNIRIKIIHPCSGEEVHGNFENKKSTSIILSIGRLEKRKGFQYVLLAVKELVKKYPDIKYLIAGDGPYNSELLSIINDNHLEDHCQLLGRISEEEKKQLLSKCLLLTMPSFYDESGSVEGFGIVFIEANAYGKPVIGTYSGGIPDAIKNNETGILVKEHSVQELIEAIDSILSGKVIINREECLRWARIHYYHNIASEYKKEIEKTMLS